MIKVGGVRKRIWSASLDWLQLWLFCGLLMSCG